jgi:hypothetical protein
MPLGRVVVGHSGAVRDAVDVASEVERWFEAQGFRVVLRGRNDGVAADLVGDVNPSVVIRDYAIAPDSTLAVLAAEQRWLVEEETRGAVPGKNYVDKARERLRRALEDD